MHGFGTLSYCNESTNAIDEVGRYQHDFTLPIAWSNRRVFLVFEGVMTDTHAEINGHTVGPDYQGGFYRFSYDVTRFLRFNESNRLEVLVHKRSANASVNSAERTGDYWNFGGIYRPVYLEAVPSRHIERLAIDARANGELTIEVLANNQHAGAQSGLRVAAQITETNGRPVGPVFTSKLDGNKAILKSKVHAPRQWSAETPNLYCVQVQLLNDKQLEHRLTQRFGFRTMEIRKGDGLYLNGRRIILKGANRHSFWPDSGRCLSEAIHRLDIQLIKEMNMNAVRMSHYPPDQQFLDLCDELGLYVLDELAGWQDKYETATGRGLIERMVQRDVNHPCILFWDNGNEGGWNTDLDTEYARWDPQQRGVLHPWTTFSSINTAHYMRYDQAQEACKGIPFIAKGSQPTSDAKTIYMPTEFMHGLFDGGAGAGLEDYWNLMWQSKVLGGGFIWALVDEGVKRPETGKIDVFGNRAPDGILGPYRQKEASFYTVKELWSPIVVRLPSKSQVPLDCVPSSLDVENRYGFTDARQCDFSWELRQFHLPNESQAGFKILAQGKAKSPSIPPGSKGSLALSVPSIPEADALALRVNDPNGMELWTWVWPLTHFSNFRDVINSAAPVQEPVVTEDAEEIKLRAGDLTVRVSKRTGLLGSVEKGQKVFSISNGPRPVAGTATLAKLEKRTEGSDLVLTASFEGDLRSVSWRLRGNGWLQCAYTYEAKGPQDFHGVAFDYPEQMVVKKRWLGQGPYRVWKNRLRGVTLNVWENDYNNTITGYQDWVYPEFKGCFGNVAWMQLTTTQGMITVVPGTESPFVQVLTPELPPADLRAKTDLSLPRVGLAFLNGISPIGNKFLSAKFGGPQGQPNVTNGKYSGSVDFYFGQAF